MNEPIAIVGSSCRFPGGASSPSKLWELLRDPKDVLIPFPPERLNLSSFYNKSGEHHGTTDVPNKSYLLTEDHRMFDAAFFNINPMEADSMDPQQRLLLETVYEAFEGAGYTISQMQETLTSVFVGVMTGDYYDIQLRDTETMARYHATGTARSILSNRISYFFNLTGPSMTIDTACSSSLVAVHQAVLSLRNGDSKLAVVAGANMLLDPTMYIAESKLHMLSSTARSRMWDKSADGYARGEGFAAIMLKPLSVALKDGDHIECLIRGSGVNSDGRTTGITMPSASAQAALIRRTYQSAGLDCVHDRPQFFECHGTGTKAGDPVEAQAIQETFFPIKNPIAPSYQSHEKLYVGSVKTVIGHLEGCAGLAGLLKASLAIQNRCIPPNMHFKELNPNIEPFYQHLEIPTRATPWPTNANTPLRASVNSFGFGGTNAHVILESFDPGPARPSSSSTVLSEQDGGGTFVGPLVLSANTQSSLLANVKELAEHLKLSSSTNLRDLSWVYQTRRSTFPIKTTFSGATREKLIEYMDQAVKNAEDGSGSHFGTTTDTHSSQDEPGVLGIFTGQGAQWAKMGCALIKSCRIFGESIERCEMSLASLSDGPTWALKEELMAEESQSRLAEAALSQPLCTAVQIAMVDLAIAAGIKFSAVVGHSSGEIAAAYAAGIISSADAIRIAYYRGVYANLACSFEGESGAMMAVGLSYDEASIFCQQAPLVGRIGIAASNSSNSTTLSGDSDAIDEAKRILDLENTFARKLLVDTAYHSKHMLKCAKPYLDSLLKCNIQISQPRDDCVWVSSVRGDAELLEQGLDSLSGQYWVDNMVKPVLFSQAIECSLCAGGPFDIVLEIGPHPALKGPATQILKSALGSSLPYVGMMRRTTDDVEVFSGGIGYIWSYLGESGVNFDTYRRAFEPIENEKPQMVKNLPAYSWDHGRLYWQESRISQNYRLRHNRPHELLGRRAADDSEYELRWQNVLRLHELPWLKDHIFQGQAIFPAAGYVAMAIEAAGAIKEGRPITVIEVKDVVLPKALVVEDDQKGVETIFTVKRVNGSNGLKHADNYIYEAEFACYICPLGATGRLEKTCSGQLLLCFGQASIGELPGRSAGSQQLSPVNVDRFYNKLLSIGLNYQGAFRATTSAQRSSDCASTFASWNTDALGDQYMIHPAVIDVAFQSVFAAVASPESDSLWSPYLPVGISRLIFNPSISFDAGDRGVSSYMTSFLTKSSVSFIEGDIHVSNHDGKVGIQVEGLSLKSFAEPSASDDRLLFSEEIWDLDLGSGFDGLVEELPNTNEAYLVDAIERTALYYFKSVFSRLSQAEVSRFKWHHQRMFETVSELLSSIRNGRHPTAKEEWLYDSRDYILALKQQFQGQIDIELMHAIGENLPAVLRSETQLLEVMLKNDMLNRLYMEGRSFVPLNKYIARVAQKVTFKHPRMKILEIGAGTGGTTRSVLDSIGDAYSTYTYTDISSAFFEKAADKFLDHQGKIDFRVLDIEKDVAKQGFEEQSYDTIIAANVLHATKSLQETMQHVRKLLKPGGYLILMEVTGNLLVLPFVMGGLPGWWLGVDEGRRTSPGISPVEWDTLLRSTGFTGVDKVLHDIPDSVKHSCSVIVSQAENDSFQLLREPLSSPLSILGTESILIIGGKTLTTAKLVRDTQFLLSPSKVQTTVVDDLHNLRSKLFSSLTSVICLLELDDPLFSGTLTMEEIALLQKLFSNCTNILWVTTGRLHVNSHSNMTIGVGRAVAAEIPQLNLQFLDIDSPRSLDGKTLLETFLRLALINLVEFTKQNMVWTREPEIAIIAGSVHLPRVIPNMILNNRLNGLRRDITKRVNTGIIPVEMVVSGDHIALHTKFPLGQLLSGHEYLDVGYSLILPAGKYLCLGAIRTNGSRAVAFSSYHASTIKVPSDDIFLLEKHQNCDPATLRGMANHLILAALIMDVPNTGSTIVYEADRVFAETIVHSCLWRDRRIHFVTSKWTGRSDRCIYIHPRSSRGYIREAIPKDATCIIDLTVDGSQSIMSAMPKSCSVRSLGSVSWDWTRAMGVAKQLERSFYETTSSPTSESTISIIPIQQAEKNVAPLGNYSDVIDWTQSEFITAMIEPFNAAHMFSVDKTYFLVGLTSELGLSLCAWMVRNGARHLALTSRSATIDKSWLIKMRGLGASIKVYKMDVSNRAAVHSVYSDICSTMPVIGGVCNAAMVLHDKLFMDMDEDIMNNTLRPKVEGTKHLDELFSTSSLEFFILFSSLGSVVGNGGQSNYHAANLFLESLAAGRRAKGLVASVISIGMVVDVGYIARTGEALIDRLRKLFYMPLSETDIHHLFGEAIIASTSGSKLGADIIMGLQPFTDSPNAKSRPPWYLNPRFSHFIRDADKSSTKQYSTLSVLNLKDQLENAISEEATALAIQASFSQKLESMLQLDSNTINCSMPLLDLGMDSLLAVEIRTWFLKEVQVDIPVLKLLSGDTVTDICIEAARIFLTFKLEKSLLQKTEPTLEHDKSPLPNITKERGNYSNSESELSVEPETPNTSPPISSPQCSSQASVHTDFEGEASVCGSITETSDSVQEEEFTRLELMSAPQSRIWFMQSYQDYPTAYNITVSYLVEGNLDVEKFHRALISVVARHASFRTCFFEQPGSGKLMQGLLIRSPDCLKVIEMASDEDLAQELQRYKSRVWDLVGGETFQATLLLKSSSPHEIIFGYHHIIIDGISWHLFLQELNAAYQMLPLRRVKTQCFDFSVEQQRAIQNGAFETQINFWKNMHLPLPGIMPLLPFAKVKSRINSNHNGIQTSLQELDADHTSKIKLAANALRITPFHFYLSAMQVLFSKLLDLEDICIGVTDANRNVAGYSDIVGYFLNMMALRFQIDRNEQFSKLAKRTAQKVYAASENSDVPFDLVLERLDIPRSSAHTPLFQVALNYRMGDMAEVPLGDCKLSYSSVEEACNPYDLAFNVTQTQTGSCVIQITSQARLYTPEATQLILDLFVFLLDDISSDTSLRVSECRLYNQAKAKSSLAVGRGVRMSSGWPDTLSERFDMIQTQFADEVAVKDNTSSVTYKQLATLAENIAGSLLALDMPVGSVIGVICEPSIRTIASLLAIIHIGCVYVPLDLSLPPARLSVIVEDCQPKVIICEDSTFDAAGQLGCPKEVVFNVCSVKTNVRNQVEARWLSTGPAFLLYTSGSTGVPKGILLSQAGFVNYLAAKSQELSLGQEVVLQQSSFGFDMSIAQVFNALAHGGTLVIVPSRIRGDPMEIAKLMLAEKVSFTIATPSEYVSLLRYGREYLTPSWRHACCGGEVVSEQLKREFRNASPMTSPRITNCYGPTEISAATSFQHVSLTSANSSISDEYSCVGRAIPNTSIYIVDDQCQLVPPGFPGEICIGGAGLALGYFKETLLNKTKFLKDPFALPEDVARGWTMMHRTGDQGILNRDGSLVFIGRKDGDTQIKLRGLRIDLGDVENALLNVSRGLFAGAIVTIRDDSLVAHVVVAQGEVISDLELQSLVRNLPLPQYMHPAMVVRLDRLPTNANGKTDRKAIESLRLPSPTSAARSRLSLLEGELRLVWLENLPQTFASHIDAESDFFMLGGNSFLLVKLQSGIKESMGVRIPLQQLYASSSLGTMAELVGNGRSQLLPAAAIDWDSETKYVIQSSSVQNYSTGNMQDHNRNVLLTGASSFLGNAILNALLQDPRVGKVFCIALSEDRQMLLPASQKIVPYTGSLLIRNCGLSKAQMAELESTVDLILHAGSIGHCLNNYSSVQFPNVQSTRSLANIALVRKVPFHFISSNRVTLLSGHTSIPPVSVSNHLPPTDGTEGLTASKWASERFLENVACATQLEVCVHRPCAATGGSAPSDDALTSLLRFSSLLKAVPVFKNMEGFFDFKDVDSIASDITQEALSTTAITPESPSFRVRHHSSKIRVPVGEIRQHLEKIYESDFEELSLSEWIERAIPLGIDGLVTSYLEAVVEKNGPMLFPYLGEDVL